MARTESSREGARRAVTSIDNDYYEGALVVFDLVAAAVFDFSGRPSEGQSPLENQLLTVMGIFGAGEGRSLALICISFSRYFASPAVTGISIRRSGSQRPAHL